MSRRVRREQAVPPKGWSLPEQTLSQASAQMLSQMREAEQTAAGERTGHTCRALSPGVSRGPGEGQQPRLGTVWGFPGVRGALPTLEGPRTGPCRVPSSLAQRLSGGGCNTGQAPETRKSTIHVLQRAKLKVFVPSWKFYF